MTSIKIAPTPDNRPYIWAREGISGLAAATASVLGTFPANKLVLRQQLSGDTMLSDARLLWREGFRACYRGATLPVAFRGTTSALMFSTYADTLHVFKSYVPNAPKSVSFGVAVSVAALVESLPAPFERCLTLLQLPSSTDSIRSVRTAFKLIHQHGFKEHYRGLTPIIWRNLGGNALYFGAREPLKQLFPAAASATAQHSTNMLVGIVLGAISTTVFYPLSLAKHQMQAKLGGAYESLWSVWQRNVIARGSVRSLFHGAHLNLVRSCIQWGITNCVYEAVSDGLDAIVGSSRT